MGGAMAQNGFNTRIKKEYFQNAAGCGVVLPI
jgi:hypothetical protein